MKMSVVILLTIKLLFINGCATMPRPQSTLNDIEFVIYPCIVNVNNEYFLRYQIKLPNTKTLNLKRVVYCKIVEDKAYYYFSTPISHPEKGQIIEIPLEKDVVAFAEKNAIYWLNSDQSEVKLKIVKE